MLNAGLRGEVRSFLWVALDKRPIGPGTEEGNSNGYDQVFIQLSLNTYTHSDKQQNNSHLVDHTRAEVPP